MDYYFIIIIIFWKLKHVKIKSNQIKSGILFFYRTTTQHKMPKRSLLFLHSTLLLFHSHTQYMYLQDEQQPAPEVSAAEQGEWDQCWEKLHTCCFRGDKKVHNRAPPNEN